jgi:hypothetical protein
MSEEKDWFAGRTTDPHEQCYWRRVGAAVFFGIVLALFVGLTQGCASPQTFQGTCALKLAGTGDNGVAFFLTYCEAQ